jgi:hypothetical protein
MMIPTLLKTTPNWLLWRYEDKGNPKLDKVPYQCNGFRAKSTDSKTWNTYEAVLEKKDQFDGIGFAGFDQCRIIGIDLDHCLDSPQAQAIIELLDSYTEISPSGNGIRIFILGRKPGTRCKVIHSWGEVECYSWGRFLTFTENTIREMEIQERQEALDKFYYTYMVKANDMNEAESIKKKILASKAKAKFTKLWMGDTSGHGNDDNRADLALCSMIAFWTKDEQVIDQLFRKSELMRSKWDEQHGEKTYGEMTIAKSLEGQPDKKEKRTLYSIVQDKLEMWQTPDKIYYCTADGVHNQLDAESCKDALLRIADAEHYLTTKTEVDNVLFNLRSKATEVHSIYHRRARVGDTIYIDLCNEEKQVIEIDKDGWRLTTEEPVRFYRPNNSAALPVPERGGDIELLRKFINTNDEHFELVVAFLLDAYKCLPPYYCLVVNGVSGSAKTTMNAMIRSLIDPVFGAAVSLLPANVPDLVSGLPGSASLHYQNASRLEPWLSDTFCTILSGAGFRFRKYYTQGEEHIVSACMPIVLDGIPDFSDASDLQNRALRILLEQLDAWKIPSKMLKDWEAVKPAILGSILDLCVIGLNSTKEYSGHRMSENASWVIKCGRTKFIIAMQASMESLDEIALDSSMAGAALQEYLITHKGFSGTYKELLELLTDYSNERYMPKRPKGLANDIRRLKPVLARQGWKVKEHGRTENGYKISILPVLAELNMGGNPVPLEKIIISSSSSKINADSCSASSTFLNEPIPNNPFGKRGRGVVLTHHNQAIDKNGKLIELDHAKGRAEAIAKQEAELAREMQRQKDMAAVVPPVVEEQAVEGWDELQAFLNSEKSLSS